jgi:hypothetical protein
MVIPAPIALLYAPADAARPAQCGVEAEAHIVELTDDLIASAMGDAWWSDPLIVAATAAGEVDRFWDWRGSTVDYEGEDVRLERLAVATGDGAVQGIMWVTAGGVPMEGDLDQGHAGLFIERLFAAPRNRPNLIERPDQPIFYGVGLQLVRTAVGLSRERGCAGRLKLDASPGALAWYARRGFHALPGRRMVYESVEYTPMELSAADADRL